MDPFREPTLWNGSRFRYEEVSFETKPASASPATSSALARFRPPYPGVVIMHGGAANQEMYFWAAQGLAEAGYMVLTFNIARPTTRTTRTPSRRSTTSRARATRARPSSTAATSALPATPPAAWR